MLRLALLHSHTPAPSSSLLEKWIPEIQHHCPDVPFLLVGTKSDLRDDAGIRKQLATRGDEMVTRQEAKAKAAELGAAGYLECSARTQEGLKSVFDEAIRNHLNQPGKKMRSRRKNCTLL